jgi:glyoxylase-like metal-dependent hydrolase (beta-lactamase superfamily II)
MPLCYCKRALETRRATIQTCLPAYFAKPSPSVPCAATALCWQIWRREKRLLSTPATRSRTFWPGWLGIPTPEKVTLDQSAEDGSSAGIPGLEAEVIHTPGHTPGSICLLFPKQELLLAGDTLFAGSVGRTDLPGGDTRALLRSLHTRLLPLPENTLVVPGHGEETVMGQERETNPFLQSDMRPGS